ncbi:FAD-binding domain-containing protein [Xylaria intraflava]|nr:FAD-binding domain-containing protein [Xylaria intraflava]
MMFSVISLIITKMKALTYQSFLAALLALGRGSAAWLEAQSDDGSCKSFPGTASWPSEQTWASFNQSTGGKLINSGPPPGAVCHPDQPNWDPDQCAIVTAAWSTYEFHQRNPVSNMWQQYNNDTCLVDPDTPCSSAGYPAYVVNATTAMDVKLSLEFAHKHNIRIIVKSSGHDYQGRSQAPGALSIWVHHMKSFKTYNTFRPAGCNFTIDSPAVTVGGGSQIGDIYEELDKFNQTIVGGGSKTIGIGGYITGGGHSILSPHYGMGADNALEMEIVTPMGDIVIANECQNEDLFWAMRGGGGSTFGVMTSVTLATHPTPKLVSSVIAIGTADIKAPWLWDMIAYILSQFPYLDSRGVSGYPGVSSNYTTVDEHNNTISYAGVAGVFMILDTQDINDMQAIFDPIIAHVNATWPGTAASVNSTPYPSFQSWFSVSYDTDPTGFDMYFGSRLLDQKAFMANTTILGEAFKKSKGQPYLVAGKGVREAKPRGGSTAVTPAWRKAYAHAASTNVFAPLSAAARVQSLATVNALTEPLRQLAPDSGAYLNENNPGEPDWEHAFWGENYARLLRIKRAVDPDDVFWCHPCVGNDRWRPSGYRLCRVNGTEAQG